MLNNLAKHLADKLLLIGSITKDERELYIYGFFMLLSNLMYLILACFFGLILGCLVESIIFYIAFQLIRRYAGGYHASTETRCEILSTFFIVVCIVTIKLADLHGFQNILFIAALVSAVCIFFLCPLDTPEKPLSGEEFRQFRKISRFILLGLVSVVVISYSKWFRILLVPCCLGLILECILLVTEKAKRILLARQNKHV